MKLQSYLPYILVFVLIFIPIFGFLDVLPLRLWDESRLAVNAYEMSKNGNWIVTYFDGSPDMWNTKPPLMIWLQVLCIKMFGINEVATRFPAALAAFFTCCLLLFFTTRYLKEKWIGLFAVLVLITTQGYVHEHGIRTGDYDSLLTFFTTLYCFCFFAYTETQKTKYLYFFFITLTLSVLTKGINGLLFLPALFIYSLIEKQTMTIIKNKHLYSGLFIFAFFVVGYYLLREHYNHGYIAAVQENELGGRFLKEKEVDNPGFLEYYNLGLQWRFKVWAMFFFLGAVISLFCKELKTRKLAVFSLLCSLIFFLVISFGKTKHAWYDLPLYPFLSIIVANFVFFIFRGLSEIDYLKQYLTYNIAPYIFLFVTFAAPYAEIWNKTYKPIEPENNLFCGSYYLKETIEGKHNIKGFSMMVAYSQHYMLYAQLLRDKGVNVDFKDFKNLKKGDNVFCTTYELRDYVAQHYLADTLKNEKGVFFYAIKGVKVAKDSIQKDKTKYKN